MPFLVLRRYTLCACLQRKRPRRDNATSTDDDDTYGVIAPTANGTSSENKSTVTVKNGSAKSSRADEVKPPYKEGRSRTFISAFRKSHAQRELPQLPTTSSKKVSFFPADLPLIDDGAPTYESIDNDENDSISDPHYSMVVNGPALRYDYPTFGPRERRKRVEEPFYTSASQTYSVGSEDPYSSIVSENEGGRKALNDDASSSYDPGYARVRDGPKEGPSTSTFSNIDALYAKVNRPFSRKREPLYAPSQGPPTLPDSALEIGNREVPVMRQESFYQLGESGSGSVVSDSSGSRNPSYRYLTVRENIEVVRERIRRQQAELEESTPAIREHYYSTIGNDYETVGSIREGTYSVVDEDAASASRSRTVEQSTPITSPLELRLRHSMPHANGDMEPPPEPPKPPTSPIPNRIPGETPPPRPIILSANFAPLPRIAEITSVVHSNGSAASAYTSSRATSQPDLAATSVFRSWKERNSAYQSRPMSTYLPSTNSAYVHPDEPPAVMSLSMEEPSTSSSDSTKKRSHSSHIPVPLKSLHNMRQRSPSPKVEASTQTGRAGPTELNQDQDRRRRAMSPKTLPPLPAPVGHDYISPVDLGTVRSWPLGRKENGDC